MGRASRTRIGPQVVAACWLAAIVAAATSTIAPADAQDLTPIWQVQGSGASSPLVDKTVTTEGVVTGFYPSATLDGFFIQAVGAGDGNPATSDGLFVFDGNRDFATKIGDVVTVSGVVKEYYNQTEIQLDRAQTTGTAPVPSAVHVDAMPTSPAAAAAYMEPFEGMRVAAPALFVVGATNAYGEVYGVPAASGVQRVFRQDLEGRLLGMAFPNGWLMATYGDRIDDAVGPLAYQYDNWMVAVDKDTMPRVTSGGHAVTNARPSGPDELTVASYNVENFFDVVDDPGKDDADSTVSPEEYAVAVARRARSVGEYLAAPDIIGFAEVEHEQQLIDLAHSPYLAAYHYDAKLIEGYDARGIDVGFMWKQGKLRLVSAEVRQACTGLQVAEPNAACTQANGAAGWLLYSRPPLVATFEILATGGRFTLIMNHFKSKRGGDDTTTPTRTEMAKHNLQLLEEQKRLSPDQPVFIMGDLNDFEDSVPIRTLTDSGRLVDLHSRVPHDENYSYVFSGVSQIIDYILVEPSFVPDITEFKPQHVNADFPAPAPHDLSMTSPRTTDHDPLLLRFPLRAVPAPGPRIYLPWTGKLVGMVQPTDEPGTPLPPTMPPAPSLTPGGPNPTSPPSTMLPVTPDATPTMIPPTPKTEPPTPSPTAPLPGPTATPGGQIGPPRTPLKITDLFYDGVAGRNEPDEYLEFKNMTASDVDLAGWRVVSVQGNQIYHFKTGARINAGQTCRLYTAEDHAEWCGFNWANTQSGIWANAGDKAEIDDASGALVDYKCYGSREGECP